jgi:hypothetical protein
MVGSMEERWVMDRISRKRTVVGDGYWVGEVNGWRCSFACGYPSCWSACYLFGIGGTVVPLPFFWPIWRSVRDLNGVRWALGVWDGECQRRGKSRVEVRMG